MSFQFWKVRQGSKATIKILDFEGGFDNSMYFNVKPLKKVFLLNICRQVLAGNDPRKDEDSWGIRSASVNRVIETLIEHPALTHAMFNFLDLELKCLEGQDDKERANVPKMEGSLDSHRAIVAERDLAYVAFEVMRKLICTEEQRLAVKPATFHYLGANGASAA